MICNRLQWLNLGIKNKKKQKKIEKVCIIILKHGETQRVRPKIYALSNQRRTYV